MSYYFFLGDTMLPVPPPSMMTKINGTNETVTLINEGVVNIIKKPGLTDISFQTEFPSSPRPYANYDTSLRDSLINELTTRLLGTSFTFKKASYYIERLNKLKSSYEPFRFILSRFTQNGSLVWNTNMLVTLESYAVTDDYQEGLDAIVDIQMKMYRPYGTKECEIQKDENGNENIIIHDNRYSPSPDIPNTYRIQAERSVFEACKGLSDGGLSWRDAAKRSGITNPLERNLRGKVLKLG